MIKTHQPSFLFLFLLISFGSVSAVLFTPALPEISHYFGVKESLTRLTITIFLIGYAVGQLIYGPIANGYGRKPAIILGILLEIIASLACIVAGAVDSFVLLVIARFIMAIGASVGLSMSFTLVADCYSMVDGKRIVAYLMMAFAITPGLGVALGGFLSEHYHWQSCFYASALYGAALLLLIYRTAETAPLIDKKALQLTSIVKKYSETLTNIPLICGSLLIGSGTSFVYSFAAIAPFLTMKVMHLSPSQYGLWNLVPAIGILVGSHLSATYAKYLTAVKGAGLGLSILILGTLMMLSAFLGKIINAPTLFIPMAIIYIGMGFIFSNASSLVVHSSPDKSSASAMMSFLNMGSATLSVLIIGSIDTSSSFLLPISYSILALFGIFVFICLVKSLPKSIASITKTP